MTLRHPLAVQLYSGRNFPPLESQIAVAARAGFTHVETFGPLNEKAKGTRVLLDRHGLSAASAHMGLDWIEADTARAIAAARTLGADFVVAPYLPPDKRPVGRAGWIALGERLARARDAVARSGLRFAWHNHDFEFAPLSDGSLPIEHVLGADLAWEADLAWMARAGADPIAWVERYRGRMPLVHVKDIAPSGQKIDEGGWADVGAGVLPWANLWSSCVTAGAEVMIAEHDNPSNFERFAQASASAMLAFASRTSAP
jgi:sugar phosphate isomerase/epimerase